MGAFYRFSVYSNGDICDGKKIPSLLESQNPAHTRLVVRSSEPGSRLKTDESHQKRVVNQNLIYLQFD